MLDCRCRVQVSAGLAETPAQEPRLRVGGQTRFGVGQAGAHLSWPDMNEVPSSRGSNTPPDLAEAIVVSQLQEGRVQREVAAAEPSATTPSKAPQTAKMARLCTPVRLPALALQYGLGEFVRPPAWLSSTASAAAHTFHLADTRQARGAARGQTKK